jgi:hypothetical protein
MKYINYTTKLKKRLLSKLARYVGFLEDEACRIGVYLPVHEDSSTESTTKSPLVVEFQKKANLRKNIYSLIAQAKIGVKSSFLALFIIIAINFNYAYGFQISDIYVEAKGNNQFEAKIRAQKQGLLRAFLLYANKMGLSNDNFDNITLEEVKSSIESVVYNNEKTTNNSYSALAEYNFNRQIATNIFYNLSSKKYKNKFLECLVLPVMRVGKTSHLWDKSIKWIKAWDNNKELLSQNRVFLLASENPYYDKLLPQTINHLTYKDFEAIYPDLLIKKFYIVIAELFTNLDTGQSYLQVEYREMGIKTTSSIVKKYNLQSTANLELTLNEIISKFADDYGGKLENMDKNSFENIIAKEKERLTQGKLHSILMNVETAGPGQWERIRAKLDQINLIEKIIIESQNENNYVLEIKYKQNIESLTQALLEVGLTYNVAKNKYYLTESNDGI